MPASDKHSDLFYLSVSDEEKNIYNIGTCWHDLAQRIGARKSWQTLALLISWLGLVWF